MQTVRTEYWVDQMWATPEYQQMKVDNFNSVDSELTSAPKTILDIGCGLAWESRLFNEKYGSELWLLDGDTSSNSNKPENANDVGWNETSDHFLFYTPLSQLKNQLDELGTKNYHLIDANNINIPDDIKFDIITSWVSCGFHYPANTYKELIQKHSHKDTRIFLDLRARLKTFDIVSSDVEIVKVVKSYGKRVTAEIRFKS